MDFPPGLPQLTPLLLFVLSFIYLFIFGCVGSSLLCEGFLQLRRAGATLHRGARASHYRGLSCCGAQAPDAQAQQLWLTGPAAPRHVGSSRTGARTRVPCIGRWILNHCATREALLFVLYVSMLVPLINHKSSTLLWLVSLRCPTIISNQFQFFTIKIDSIPLFVKRNNILPNKC